MFSDFVETLFVCLIDNERVVRCSDLPVEDLTITRKISTNEKNLVELGLGKPGDRVRFVGNFRDWGIEYGAILTVVEDCDEWIKTRTAGRKPISVLRSDLECLGVNNLPNA